MLLKSLKLANIRSYLNGEINFPEGLVLLSGDVGSGKSSVLLAIEFALFGIRRTELPGSLLLRKGKSTGSVELNFSIDGKDVTIKRTLKKTKDDVQQDTGYIIIDGLKKEGTAIELKSILFDLLGYPKELVTKSKSLIYRYTVYTPQEEMKQILLEDEEQRLNILRKVFAIDKYKKVRDNTNIFIKELKEKKKEFEGRLVGLEEKKTEKEKQEKELESLAARLNELYPILESLKSELSRGKEEINKLEQGIKELNFLKKELDLNSLKIKEKTLNIKKNEQSVTELNGQLDNIKKRLEEFKIEFSEEELEKEIELREKELNEIRHKRFILEERIKATKLKIEELKEETKEKLSNEAKLKEKAQLCKELAESIIHKGEVLLKTEQTNAALEDTEKKIKELEVKKQHSEEIIQNINSVDRCPVCYQDVPMEHKERIRNSEKKNVSLLEEQLEYFTKEKENIASNLKKLRAQWEDIHLKEKELERNKAELNSLKETIKRLIDRGSILSVLDKENKECNESLAKLNKVNMADKAKEILSLKQMLKDAREKNHLTNLLNDKICLLTKFTNEQQIFANEIDSLKKETEELKKRLESIGNIEEDYNLKRKEFDETLAKERGLSIKIASLEKEKQGIDNIISALKKEIALKLGYKKSLKQLTNLQTWLEEYFINLMGVIEKHVMVRVNREFNELFAEWFSALMESETLNVRLDDRFTPVIEQDGYEIGISNLSGGERTSLALAYRLALNKVINELITDIKTKDLIVLDEPTDGFSSEQLDKVRAVLEQLKIKQVIIVSHESKIESFVNTIIRIDKENNVSRVL